MSKQDQSDTIQLLRGGAMVSSLAGAFGGQLRETRLTAMLGYLIALKPIPFCELFGFKGHPSSVSLEHRHGQKRSDIQIETTRGTGIVEAKIDSSDPTGQAKQYKGKWHVLLTQGIAAPSERQRRNIRHLRWSQVAKLLKSIIKSENGRVRFIAEDLITYLEEYHMIKPKESVEIYARDMNDDTSLELFFRLRVYCCQHRVNTRLPEAQYFAPCFGQRAKGSNAGIQQGISYISRIENVETAYTWADFTQLLRGNRSKAILNKSKEPLNEFRKKWEEDNSKRYLLFLNTPRLAFNPPIRKVFLQDGTGFLGKHFFTFDDLFRAWNSEKR